MHAETPESATSSIALGTPAIGTTPPLPPYQQRSPPSLCVRHPIDPPIATDAAAKGPQSVNVVGNPLEQPVDAVGRLPHCPSQRRCPSGETTHVTFSVVASST